MLNAFFETGRIDHRAALALTVLGALATGLWLGRALDGERPGSLPIAGFHLPQPKPLTPFELIDGDGQPFRWENLRGRWTFLYFGYTSCPDVCPTAMFQLERTCRLLDQRGEADRTAWVLVTVDPERDSPERLREYTRHFNPRFVGVTGTDQSLARFARQLGVLYQKSTGQTAGGEYTMDHSSTVMLVDPAVRLTAVFTPPFDPEIVARDFKRIVRNRVSARTGG